LIDRLREDASEEYLDSLADELHSIDEMAALADELAVVALYRIVEINTKRLRASAHFG